MNIYNTNYEAASFIYAILFYIFLQVKYQNNAPSNERMKKLIKACLAALALDLFTSVCITYADVIDPVLNSIMSGMYFFSLVLLTFSVTKFYMTFMNLSETYMNVLNVIIIVLTLVSLIALVINVKTGTFFTFKHGYYEHGHLYSMCYFMPVIYFLLTFVSIIIGRKGVSRKNFICLLAGLLMAPSGAIIQFFFRPDILLSNATTIYALSFGALTLETPAYAEMIQKKHDLEELNDHLEERADEVVKEAEIKSHEEKIFSEQIMNVISETIDYSNHTDGDKARLSADASKKTALEMGYSEDFATDIYYMAIVHDVGMIGIPDEILEKHGVYTDDERKAMQKHTLIGFRIISNITQINNIGIAARWHHERYDGKGYPDGLKGEAIPVEARIVGVADAYYGMTGERVYKKKMTEEEAKAELKRCSGSQFDPKVVQAFLNVV